MGHFAAQHSMLAKYFTKSRKCYLLFLCRGGRAQFGGLGGRLLAPRPGPHLTGGQAPVPPTVILSMRSVGWPTPTGTP